LHSREDIKANSEPYDEELKLISNLIQYCLRFEFPSLPNPTTSCESPVKSAVPSVSNGFLCVPGQLPLRRGSEGKTPVGGAGDSSASSIYATPLGVTPASTPSSGDAKSGTENCFLYKKDDADEALFAGVQKKVSRKNSRNERRNSKAKLLNHVPEIYLQFGKFTIKPPVSTKDVVNVIECLKEKQVGKFI
jgi:hypothetical protein